MNLFSKFGLLLALVFSAYAAYNSYLASTGAWQAPILNAIVTFPFSVAANAFCDWLQPVANLSHERRNSIEAILIFAIGVCEFYSIGWMVERLLARARSNSR